MGDIDDSYDGFDDDDDDEEYPQLEDHLHRCVRFRLDDMIARPQAYGRTREAVILQLVLIVEFALLAHPSVNLDASFDDLLSMFPGDAMADPQKVPTHDWIKQCATATGAYIGMKIAEVQMVHDASCPYCRPGPTGMSN